MPLFCLVNRITPPGLFYYLWGNLPKHLRYVEYQSRQIIYYYFEFVQAFILWSVKFGVTHNRTSTVMTFQETDDVSLVTEITLGLCTQTS